MGSDAWILKGNLLIFYSKSVHPTVETMQHAQLWQQAELLVLLDFEGYI